MRAERRIPSFLSTNNLADKENKPPRGVSSHLRHQRVYGRRRCARTVVSNSQSLGTVIIPTDNPETPPETSASSAPSASAPSSPSAPSALTTNSGPFLFPRRLTRPRFRAIDPRAIRAIDTDLERIPLNYIQRTLEKIGPRLLHATATAKAIPPFRHLPKELRVICHDVSVEPPSHVIAAYFNPGTRIILYPVHAIIIATYCANVPVLPVSKPPTPATAGESVTLPVVTLRMPNPIMFPVLLAYLYTKRSDTLLKQLLPADSQSAMPELIRAHANTMTVKALLHCIRKAWALWTNASALCICDDKLFRSLETAWEVLLEALAMKSGKPLGSRIDLNDFE